MAHIDDRISAEDGRFKPGNPGGPGRPIGARHKLGEAFLKAMMESFEEINPETKQPFGIEAIRKTRNEEPSIYARIIASILPKEIKGADDGPIRLVIERRIVDPK